MNTTQKDSCSSKEHLGRVKPALIQRIVNNDFKANAIYSKALGYPGLGAAEKANELLNKALAINPTHLGAKMHLKRKWLPKQVAKRFLKGSADYF